MQPCRAEKIIYNFISLQCVYQQSKMGINHLPPLSNCSQPVTHNHFRDKITLSQGSPKFLILFGRVCVTTVVLFNRGMILNIVVRRGFLPFTENALTVLALECCQLLQNGINEHDFWATDQNSCICICQQNF